MLVSAFAAAIKTALGSAIPASPYPMVLPENPVLPAIVYSLIGGESMPTLTGPGMQKRRIQIDVVAANYAAAEPIREQVIAFLNGFRGALSDGTLVQYVQLIQPLDMPFWNDARQYRCAAEFYVYFD